MLANKHVSICPYHSDAQNFLLEESKEKEKVEGIPDYLYLVCNDLLIFHDCLCNEGIYARNVIRKRVIDFDNLLATSTRTNDESSKHHYKIQLPQSLDASYDLSTLKYLAKEDEGESKTIDESSVFLAVFGWSYMKNSSNNKCIKVECPICLVRDVTVPMDAVTISRKRKSRNEDIPVPVNLVKSHRHFCPYVCQLGVEKEFGWKIVFSKSVEKLQLLQNNADVTKILKIC